MIPKNKMKKIKKNGGHKRIIKSSIPRRKYNKLKRQWSGVLVNLTW